MKQLSLGIFAALAALTLAITGAASAASTAIERAKNECIVGEQSDGFLGVVSGASVSTSLRRELREANQERKDIYADFARRNGVSIIVAGQIAANKQFAKAKKGQCVRNQSGRWVKV